MDIEQMKAELRHLTLGAVKRGSVRLSSGIVSDFYFDGRQVTLLPEGAYYIARIMGEMLNDVEYEGIGGPTMGADPIVGALCYYLFTVKNKNVSGFIVRKEAKAHGLGKMVEGPELKPGAKVVMVEDVVTSGGSILKAAKAVEEGGSQVVKMLALLDREEGAGEALAKEGYDFEAIYTRSDLE